MEETAYSVALITAEVIFSFEILRRLRNSGASGTLISLIAAAMITWLVSMFWLLKTNAFSSSSNPQLSFVLAVFIPTALGLFAIYYFKPLKGLIRALSVKDLIYLQYWRAAFGFMFFFTDHLPLWFKFIGGLGDIAAGFAPFVAVHLFLKSDQNKFVEKKALLLGNVVGIIDFVLVLNLGVFIVLKTMTSDIVFNLIPLYVVPLFILLHVISYQRWRKL